MFGLLAVPAGAEAKTFFAAQADAGLGDCTSEANACDLDQAVAAADADATDPRDTVQIVGPLTRTMPLALTASPIDLIGSGQSAGGTLIEDPMAIVADPLLDLAQTSTASNLRVRALNSHAVFMTQGSRLRDVTAEVDSPADISRAVFVSGGSGQTMIERVTAIASDEDDAGLSVVNAGGSVTRVLDSTISGDDALTSAGPGTTIVQRTAIDSSGRGVSVFGPVGATTRFVASSSTIRLRSGPGPSTDVAVSARGGAAEGSNAAVELQQMTIDGSATLGDDGIASGSAGDGSAEVTVRGSIVRGFDNDLLTDDDDATLAVGTSSFATASAPAGVIDQTTLGGNVNLDPLYVNPLAFDYRLQSTSPLIDLAGGDPIGAEESATDFAGDARILDGNADGLPARDMGAFEAPAVAPPQSLPGCPQGKNLIELGPGDDSQTGTLAGDLIFAGPGNDVIDALAGDDCVDLGLGEDRGEGGSGADLMLGGQGADTASGGSEDDNLTGGEGADNLDGGAGDDQALGGSENDRVLGGFGDDTLHGESENDRVEGSRGRDRMNGGAGNDRLTGGSGPDQINGDPGRDRIEGGSGNDRLRGNSGNDRLSGGSGRDRIAGDAGSDRISARGGGRDRISCGRGRDTVLVDRRDRVSRNCERVRRRR